MKKMIAVLLCFAMIFAFAACKNSSQNEEATTAKSTEETTGKPGEFVTNDKGEIQTKADSYVLTDEKNQPITKIVTGEDGVTTYEVVTTIVYDVETYPGAETIPTVAPGNTLAPDTQSWPTHKFMSKLPEFADKVDDVDYSKSDKGEIAVIYLNDVKYDEYLAYVAKCQKAGFENSYNIKIPEKAQNGESYIYYSVSNGLYIGITYNTDAAPYRNCDMRISISSYDVLA